MRKWTCALCVLLSMVCMCTVAVAADICKNMGELYQYWSMNCMAEWVCSVVSADGSAERLAVVVNSQAAAEELSAMVEDAASVEIIVADGSYGYNELLSVQDAISREYMGAGGKSLVVSIATGLTVTDGKVTGFGESGKELRVVVGVLEESAEEYRELFRKRYGDMVYVEAAERAVLTDVTLREPLKTVSHPWYLAGVAAVLCVMAVGAVWQLHRRAKARSVEKN